MSFEILGIVGTNKKNNVYDVKIIQALLNVYARKNVRKVLDITGKCDDELISKLVEYQNKHFNGARIQLRSATLSNIKQPMPFL
ncbi:hypothetical protein [Vibrio vulnificus]|uniref:hypothetical protein n=1 Tax=Vibrio vulnificus TaxID=672 RepID=UPI00405809C8